MVTTSSITPLHPSNSTGSRFGRALRALALGTAITVGSLRGGPALAQDANPPPLPDQPVHVQNEQPAPDQPVQEEHKHNCGTGTSVILGYGAGVLMEKLLQKLKSKAEAQRGSK